MTAAVRAVLFDFGGTLFSYAPLRPRFERLIEENAREHGIDAPPERLRESWGLAMMQTMGRFTALEYYLHRDLFAEAFERFLRRFDVAPPEGSGERFYHAQNAVAAELVAPRRDAAETLTGLRARGVHVGIVSNIDDDQFALLWERMDLAPHVDAITTSEAARSCKPHDEIYRVALRKAGGAGTDVRPEETLFVGDSVVHDVAGANALGMTSVLLARSAPAVTGPAAPRRVIPALRALLDLVDA
jgi:putative hydrolase of the HAD superfamily